MNWSERRELVDAGIPEFWNLFCIGMEQVAESFGYSKLAREHHLIAVPKRISSCLHIVRSKANSTGVRHSIDVCLDKAGRRVFARVEDNERFSLKIGLDGDHNVCLVDEQDSPVTNDRASELFLETFLYAVPPE